MRGMPYTALMLALMVMGSAGAAVTELAENHPTAMREVAEDSAGMVKAAEAEAEARAGVDYIVRAAAIVSNEFASRLRRKLGIAGAGRRLLTVPWLNSKEGHSLATKKISREAISLEAKLNEELAAAERDMKADVTTEEQSLGEGEESKQTTPAQLHSTVQEQQKHTSEAPMVLLQSAKGTAVQSPQKSSEARLKKQFNHAQAALTASNLVLMRLKEQKIKQSALNQRKKGQKGVAKRWRALQKRIVKAKAAQANAESNFQDAFENLQALEVENAKRAAVHKAVQKREALLRASKQKALKAKQRAQQAREAAARTARKLARQRGRTKAAQAKVRATRTKERKLQNKVKNVNKKGGKEMQLRDSLGSVLELKDSPAKVQAMAQLSKAAALLQIMKKGAHTDAEIAVEREVRREAYSLQKKMRRKKVASKKAPMSRKAATAHGKTALLHDIAAVASAGQDLLKELQQQEVALGRAWSLVRKARTARQADLGESTELTVDRARATVRAAAKSLMTRDTEKLGHVYSLSRTLLKHHCFEKAQVAEGKAAGRRLLGLHDLSPATTYEDAEKYFDAHLNQFEGVTGVTKQPTASKEERAGAKLATSMLKERAEEINAAHKAVKQAAVEVAAATPTSAPAKKVLKETKWADHAKDVFAMGVSKLASAVGKAYAAGYEAADAA